MNRRGFLGACLAAAAAPAIVKAASLMRLPAPHGVRVTENGVMLLGAGDWDLNFDMGVKDGSMYSLVDLETGQMEAGVLRAGEIGTVERFAVYESAPEPMHAYLEKLNKKFIDALDRESSKAAPFPGHYVRKVWIDEASGLPKIARRRLA